MKRRAERSREPRDMRPLGRLALLPILLGPLLAGCITAALRPAGLEDGFPVRNLVPGVTSAPSGAVVYSMDASVYLAYEFPWDSRRLNPVHVAFVGDDGSTWNPLTLRPEGSAHARPEDVDRGLVEEVAHVVAHDLRTLRGGARVGTPWPRQAGRPRSRWASRGSRS